MTRAFEAFRARFATWKIRLPAAAVRQRKAGRIAKGGWTIWYRFDRDEGGEFLDFYACHRMTSDSHIRLRENGSEETLPTIHEMRLSSSDPVEDARLSAAFTARNQQVAVMLEAKGFGLQGDEPTALQLNRALLLGVLD